MEETKFCQCCAMPMGQTDELYGTNKDGSKSTDYCSYCFKDGEFTADISMEEMIEVCIPHMLQSNKDMTEDEARAMMNNFFPTLNLWK